jgi:hypothetical protein
MAVHHNFYQDSRKKHQVFKNLNLGTHLIPDMNIRIRAGISYVCCEGC